MDLSPDWSQTPVLQVTSVDSGIERTEQTGSVSLQDMVEGD